MRDLSERAHAHRVHQHLEDIAVVDDGVAQALEHRRRVARVAPLEILQAHELALLLLLRGARELDLAGPAGAVRIAERIDADDRIRAVVLAMLVVEALLPLLPPLLPRPLPAHPPPPP